ncbi:YsnF/AvaK domain-containing protein [Azotobacter chroococcum]|uniref:YsnF/AvaK domain-containing protein n=1 Tax=Azotobacter chroococcum TaxID=353 RepID=A0AAQ0BZD7_9GAMM|nr:YsnF/AvaK domain-containing protein [Azotobacter chroococcum]QQE89503.1 YsnF/AvaK domain-containing protein [Azotobacter chroococcum]
MPADEPKRLESETIPVMVEEAVLHKRQVESGRVRITKSVETENCLLEESLLHDEVQVERVSCGTEVDPAHPPQVRQEGDVTVIPVLEEVLVVEKRLVLKEELRVRRVVHEEPHSVPVTLRREQVTVERTPAEVPPSQTR